MEYQLLKHQSNEAAYSTLLEQENPPSLHATQICKNYNYYDSKFIYINNLAYKYLIT